MFALIVFHFSLLCNGLRAPVWRYSKTQTHENFQRFKRTLFIRTKHNMGMFEVNPFIKLQNDT